MLSLCFLLLNLVPPFWVVFCLSFSFLVKGELEESKRLFRKLLISAADKQMISFSGCDIPEPYQLIVLQYLQQQNQLNQPHQQHQQHQQDPLAVTNTGSSELAEEMIKQLKETLSNFEEENKRLTSQVSIQCYVYFLVSLFFSLNALYRCFFLFCGFAPCFSSPSFLFS
jgi:hypothetical protein